MSGDAYRDYLDAPDYGAYRSYDAWVSHRRERREVGLLPTESHAYKVDDKWDWRDTEESSIEDLILSLRGVSADTWVAGLLVGAVAFALAWGTLAVLLAFVFNSTQGLTWEVPMNTGVIILFALCGTVLGSVAMWCVTTYQLRLAQLRERKEIRETEYNTKLLEKMEHSGGRLTMRELNR